MRLDNNMVLELNSRVFKMRPCLDESPEILIQMTRAFSNSVETIVKAINIFQVMTSPARRAWWSCKFAPFLFIFICQCRKMGYRSWVAGLPLMGYC